MRFFAEPVLEQSEGLRMTNYIRPGQYDTATEYP